MVDVAVSYTIAKVDEFVSQQVKIRRGVRRGIEWLKIELSYLLISVKAAEAHQQQEHIRLWTDEVKSVANQAVIILDRFSAQQERRAALQQGGVWDRMRGFIKKEADLFHIGRDIESLKQRVVEIKNRRDEYRINDMIVATPNVQHRRRALPRAASFDHAEDVVGFEDDVKTLLAQLCKQDLSLSLIAIHGMGGLGKSTLASKLYHYHGSSHFKHRAWVCVSEDYDITHVLRKLIICFMGDDLQDPYKKKAEIELLRQMEEVDLLRHLRKILLDGDRYLVVIDDIWDVEVWKKVKSAFPDKKNGSRVIITTRNRAVAEGADDTCFVHQLRFLNKDESWQLFCKRAKPTPNLEELGRDMVDKCKGLPLAIVVLSGLLLQNKTYTFWSDVKHQWRESKGKYPEIQEILNLSYDDLSPQMRKCFLYLARYPEDCIIPVFEIKVLWIAEDFVSEADEEDGVEMEAVAEDYLMELINRNMIQIHRMSADGQVVECRVHDLVRDLAIKKAMEQKILGIFDSSKNPHPIRLLGGQARHVIYNGIGEYLKIIGPDSDDLNLRSLSPSTETMLKIEEMKMMCNRFKYLQVLDFTSCEVEWEEIPEVIGDLILLKYLGLMKRSDDEKYLVIPSSIGKLKKLQTLSGSGDKYEFPSEMCELKELRHLDFTRLSRSSYGISSHQNKLRTIWRILASEWLEMDTVKFTNLRTLSIIGDEVIPENKNKEYSLESLANLTNLRKLIIFLGEGIISTIQPLSSCKHLKVLLLQGKLKDPAELSFLPNSITELVLHGSFFEQDPMPTLGRLPNLIVLSTWLPIYKVDKMVFSEDAFPCLQLLVLGNISGLKEVQVDDRALPCLKYFDIDEGFTEKVPQRIASLPSPKESKYCSFNLY